MKTKSIIILSLLTAFSLNAQTARKLDAGVTDSPEGLKLATNKKKKSNSNDDLSESDTGAQRPIFLKTEKISAFGGISSRIYYDDNPFSTQKDSVLSSQKDAVWSNIAYVGAGLGQVELTDAVVTPYVGASISSSEYLASNLDWLDYTSSSAYIMANIQHSNGNNENA